MAALIPLLVGLGLAGAVWVGRSAVRAYRQLQIEKIGQQKATKMGSFTNVNINQRKFIGPFQPRMSQEEALLILGLKPGCSKEQIKEAHRKIMRANHPDVGGSAFLASKINEARDVLMQHNTPI